VERLGEECGTLFAPGRVRQLLQRRPAESVELMATVTHDPGTPDTSPVGLGRLVRTVGGTKVLTMTGASPGGVAVLVVVPSQELVFAAYGNDAWVLSLHDELLLELVDGQETRTLAPVETDLRPYAGTYRSNQLRIDVRVVDRVREGRVWWWRPLSAAGVAGLVETAAGPARAGVAAGQRTGVAAGQRKPAARVGQRSSARRWRYSRTAAL
jgi:hypothetical protein